MKSRKAHRQKLKEIETADKYQGERSPYWEWVQESGYAQNEFTIANPDSVIIQKSNEPSSPQLLMGEAIEHLQGRQREVYILTMREEKSLAEAAEILKIEKSSAQVYQARAIKFITNYCKEAIERGRVQ